MSLRHDFIEKTFTAEALTRFSAPTRSPRFALRNPEACLSSSLCPAVWQGGYVIPRRDYSYEGLTAVINGENWKIVDGFAVGLFCSDSDDPVILEFVKAVVRPYRVRFEFHFTMDGRKHDFSLSLYMMNRRLANRFLSCTGAAGVIDFSSSLSNRDTDVMVRILPLADIRHMYHPSAPESHLSWTGDDALWISREGLFFAAGGSNTKAVSWAGNAKMVSTQHIISSYYRLGSGFRINVAGHPVPCGEEKKLVEPGVIITGPENRVLFACAGSVEEVKKLCAWAHGEYEENIHREEESQRGIIRRARKAPLYMNTFDIGSRITTLSKFGMHVCGADGEAKTCFLPEAGGWWFKTPWFRDVFEGIYNSLDAVMAIWGEEYPGSIIKVALELMDTKRGLVPNKIEEEGGKLQFCGTDATLLTFLTAEKYLSRVWCEALARLVLKSGRKLFQAFSHSLLDKVNGPPVLDENGLICCSSWHSWTDGKRRLVIDGQTYSLAIRIPEVWERELIAKYCHILPEDRVVAVHSVMESPYFFLPEINAQWLRVLAFLIELADKCGLRGKEARVISAVYERARPSFKRVFANVDGSLNSVVTHRKFPLGTLTDSTPGSPQVVAMDLVGEMLFSTSEIAEFVRHVIDYLLEYSGSRPFGIVVRKSGIRTYLDDNEYHEEVVWPRDIPYLVRLLKMTGREDMAVELINEHLNRQDSEGVIFYNPELYSPDNGDTPGPVPVKNPMQWWSHWVF